MALAAWPVPARRFLSGALTHGRDRPGLPRAGVRGVFRGTGLLPARSLLFRPLPREGVTCFCGGGRLGRFCSSAVSGYCHGEFPFPGRPRRLRKRGPGRGGSARRAGACPHLARCPRLAAAPPAAAKGRPCPGAAAPLSKQDGVVSAVSQAFGNRRDVSHG